MKRYLYISFGLVWHSYSTLSGSSNASCLPNFKRSDNSCVPLENEDVYRGLHFTAHPLKKSVPCRNLTTVQGIAVCEDLIPDANSSGGDGCVVWSVVASNYCDHYGSLEFEKYVL